MDPLDPLAPGTVQEILEKSPPDPLAMPVRKNGQKQELGFIGDGPRQGKAHCCLSIRVSSDDQANSMHRQDPRALGAGPRFSETIAECGLHDLHDVVEIA